MITQTPQTSPSVGPSRERRMGDGAGEQARRRRESDRHLQGTPDHADRLALGLGWFSLGLGIAQIATPRAFARMIGIRSNRRNRRVMRVIGVREVAAGLGLLTWSRPAGWLWARVGYDLTDLALLGSTLSSKRMRRGRVAAATAAVAGLTLLDTLAARRSSAAARAGRAGPDRAQQVTKAITVNRPPEELYQFWRDLQNLPRFMNHLESVQRLDERRFHWIAKMPIGTTREWDTEIVEDRPDELLAWRSLAGAKVASFGSVRFERAPGRRGTEVRVEIGYQPPGGVLGASVARLFSKVFEEHLAADLHRFKQVMETGEIVKSDASIHRGPHPAQPPA